MRKTVLLIPLVVLFLASCKDQITNIGSAYYADTIQFRTSIRTDAGFIKFSPVASPSVPAVGTTYNLTYASTMMIVGKVDDGSEHLESWGVLQFPPLTLDTIKRIAGIRLLLKNIPYRYGDTTSTHIDYQVFVAPPGNKITYSTTLLAKTDLDPAPIGSILQEGFIDSTDKVLAITLDTAIKNGPNLTTTSLAFVVTPGPTMKNARGFGTSENTGDANSVPQIEYTIRGDSGRVIIITRTPVLDMHVVSDKSVNPPQEFTLRGGVGLRELVRMDSLMRYTDSAQLNAFSTINNAVLILKLDPANSRRSNLVADSVPILVDLTNAMDTGAVPYAIGYRSDPNDPNTIRFQVRTLIEFWLRNPSRNFGLELRSGFVNRAFATAIIGVEDNTLNRWTFFGQDNPDLTKRPQLVLSYSKLHQ